MNWLPWSCRKVSPRARSLAETTKTVAHALTDRLQSLEPRAALGGIDANQLQRAMVDGKEYGGVAFLNGERCGRVRAPHLIHTLD